MKKIIIVLLFNITVVFFITTPVFSYTNEELISNCNNSESFFKVGICFGFIEGVKDSYFVLQTLNKQRIMICMPDTPMEDLINIYLNYMNNHPEQIKEPPTFTYLMSLIEAFPCK